MKQILITFVPTAVLLLLPSCAELSSEAYKREEDKAIRMRALREANNVKGKKSQALQAAVRSQQSDLKPRTQATASSSVYQPSPPLQQHTQNSGGLRFRTPDITKSLPKEQELKSGN